MNWTVFLNLLIGKYFAHKIGNIFLDISLNVCFGCLKELSHRDGSFEYLQHMFWLRNKKITFSYLKTWHMVDSLELN